MLLLAQQLAMFSFTAIHVYFINKLFYYYYQNLFTNDQHSLPNVTTNPQWSQRHVFKPFPRIYLSLSSFQLTPVSFGLLFLIPQIHSHSLHTSISPLSILKPDTQYSDASTHLWGSVRLSISWTVVGWAVFFLNYGIWVETVLNQKKYGTLIAKKPSMYLQIICNKQLQSNLASLFLQFYLCPYLQTHFCLNLFLCQLHPQSHHTSKVFHSPD